MNFVIKRLSIEDISEYMLKGYKRYHETKEVLYMTDEGLKKKKDSFIDDWTENDLVDKTRYFRYVLSKRGIVIALYTDEGIRGFSTVDPDRFGSGNQYCEMAYLHISRELRGRGLGRRLFEATVNAALMDDIPALYISTHPSVEAQAFYRGVGCVDAKEINPGILAREPLDIQLEYAISNL